MAPAKLALFYWKMHWLTTIAFMLLPKLSAPPSYVAEFIRNAQL
jgi:hypothetical protein